jgi:hypothetical protein
MEKMMQDVINSELFRQCFYGTVIAFYGVVMIWIMYSMWKDRPAKPVEFKKGWDNLEVSLVASVALSIGYFVGYVVK